MNFPIRWKIHFLLARILSDMKLVGNNEKSTEKNGYNNSTEAKKKKENSSRDKFSTYCSVNCYRARKNDEHFVFWFRFQYFSPRTTEWVFFCSSLVYHSLWNSSKPIQKICFISKQRNDIGCNIWKQKKSVQRKIDPLERKNILSMTFQWQTKYK